MLQQELQQRQAAAPMLMSLAEAQSGRERGDLARQMQAGLQMGTERKNIPAKIVTVSCECQLHYKFCRLGQLSRLSLLNK